MVHSYAALVFYLLVVTAKDRGAESDVSLIFCMCGLVDVIDVTPGSHLCEIRIE